MKINELRIGNLIQFNNLLEPTRITVVEGRFFFMFRDPDCEISNYYSPIPLTEEWLLKLGLRKIPANNSYYLSAPKLKAEIHFEIFRREYVCVLYCSTGSFIPRDIKFVHQLQNLYFALTGEELKIKIESDYY